MSFFKRAIQPLRSRKTRLALATVLAAYLAEAGLQVNEALIFTILGVGVAAILGVAIEDNGAKKKQLEEVTADRDAYAHAHAVHTVTTWNEGDPNNN